MRTETAAYLQTAGLWIFFPFAIILIVVITPLYLLWYGWPGLLAELKAPSIRSTHRLNR